MSAAVPAEEAKTDGTSASGADTSVKPPALVAVLKQLQIHSGALKRYTKELDSYLVEKTELYDELRRIQSSESSDRPFKLKQQRQAIEETEGVIADIRPRLVQTYQEVKSLLDEAKDFTIEDEEVINAAILYMEAAEKFVQS